MKFFPSFISWILIRSENCTKICVIVTEYKESMTVNNTVKLTDLKTKQKFKTRCKKRVIKAPTLKTQTVKMTLTK